MTSDVAVPQRVLDALTEGRLVLFVGAGASVDEPSNLPLFDALARKLAELAHSDYEPDLAIDFFLGSLPKDFDTHTQTKNLLSRGESRPNSTHDAITRLASAGGPLRLVTTNFDDHLAESAALQDIPVPERWDGPALPIGDDFVGLVHLHGSVLGEARRLVLTDSDFGRAYLTQAWATRFLLPMFQHFTVLFIGYSHDDPIMRYLGLGLPAGSSRYAFVSTEDALSARWARLGVSPIGYPVKQGDHAALVACLDAWATRARMGQLEHRARIQEIIRGNTSLTPVDQDYLTERIGSASGAKEFAQEVRDSTPSQRISWLRWIEGQETFQGLFRGAPQSEATSVLARWFGECFIADPDLHCEALGTVQRLGQNFSEELFNWACWAAGDLSSLDAVAGIRWKTLLGTSVQNVPNIAPLIRYLPGDSAENSAVLRTVLRPRLELKADWLAEESSEPMSRPPDVELKWPINAESLSANLLKAIEASEAGNRSLGVLLEDTLSGIHELFSAFLGKPNDRRMSFARSAIEPHDQDQFPRPIDSLIDALRTYGERAIGVDPNLPNAWWSLGYTLFQRLALHLLVEDASRTPDEKIRWLLDRTSLYAADLKHEAYRVLSVTAEHASQSVREELLSAAEAGPDYPEEVPDRERHIAYGRYNLLVWLARVAPTWVEAATKLKEIEDANPTFAPRDHPDFDHWMESGVWGRRLPMEVDEFIGRFEQRPHETLDELLKRDYSRIEFSQPEWSDALDLLRSVAESRADLGLRLWREASARSDLTTRSSEIQRAVVGGWAGADLGESSGDVLSLVGSLVNDPDSTDVICDFLSRQAEAHIEWSESESIIAMRAIANEVWDAQKESFSSVEDAGTLSFAPMYLNSWPGQLVSFWLREIDRRWRRHRAEWSGFSDEEASSLGALLSGPSATHDAVHPAFARALYFLFAADPVFAQGRLFPLFRGESSTKCWFAYLHHPRVNDKMLAGGLLELILEEWVYLDRFDEHLDVQGSFLRLVASIACFAGISGDDRRSLLAQSVVAREGAFAPAFASATIDVLRADEVDGGEVWTTWLREHVDNRLRGIPRIAKRDELMRWADVVPYLGASIPEGIEMLSSQGLDLGEGFREYNPPNGAINDYGNDLVLHYMQRLDHSSSLTGLNAYRINKLIASLREILGTEAVQPLVDRAKEKGVGE
ncbi:SIR2 family protein [Janibacter sp. Y6]|uniref:SIR2 family protein n=1 Tax=Janibacter sp. Y6 TaxID=2913552 RepID=UPI0034A4A1CF